MHGGDSTGSRTHPPGVCSSPVDGGDGRRPTDRDGRRRVEGDGGAEPIERRSDAEIQAEIEALEQELDAYETRDQQEIDRYERLLQERNRRRRETDEDPSAPGRLARLKERLLRRIGYR